MASYYTVLTKPALCTQYDEQVFLSAKYRFTENPQNDYEVKFVHATCSIQKEEYCKCSRSNCELLTDFPSIWDYRKPL